MLDQLGFTTNLGNTFGPVGGDGGEPFVFAGPVLGFHGTTAYGCVNGLGFWTMDSYISPPPPPPPPLPPQPSPPFPRPPPPPPAPFPYRRSPLWGRMGSGTTSFSDPSDLGAIRSIQIWMGTPSNFIIGIQVTYANGNTGLRGTKLQLNPRYLGHHFIGGRRVPDGHQWEEQ
eukprot:jgi/Botrbrau1/14568/Bobra.27_3s0007.1